MPYTRIDFDHPINTSLQIGDTVHFSSAQVGPSLTEPEEFGLVAEIFKEHNYIVVEQDLTAFTFVVGDYVFFSKNITVNESSLKGYHANVTLENNSGVKSELFAVSSEVAVSSK